MSVRGGWHSELRDVVDTHGRVRQVKRPPARIEEPFPPFERATTFLRPRRVHNDGSVLPLGSVSDEA